ncbi:MAG: hypothetical protein MKZ92_11125, partial [Pedosphaera sp.]|nr:hypothetical protein [Pedosphaera sp.]
MAKRLACEQLFSLNRRFPAQLGCVSPIFWHKSRPLFRKWLLFHEGSKQPIRFFWMNFRRFLLAITLIVALPMPALFADAEGTAPPSTETAVDTHGDAHGHAGGHHGLPPAAVVLPELGPFAMTNSMVLSWIVGRGLI